ncbi:MAG: alpha/beta hydrolase [Verrucomicrobiota bacterium]
MNTNRRMRNRSLHLIALTVLLGFGAIQEVFGEAPVFEFEGAEAETYKTASGDELKIYIFSPEDHDSDNDARPAIVFFFGGGWNSGSPAQFEQHCRYLASRGMVAMTADYRVKKRQGTSPKECVADGKSAIRWVRENAKRLGVDPERVAAGGGSAGGHVAAATGMVEGYDDEADDLSVSSKADALILFNPVYDNGPEDGWGHGRVEAYWESFSPAHNVSSNDPPAVVFLGSEDDLIPVSVAERFQLRMEEVGLESELHVYEGEGHGFFNEKKGGPDVFKDTIRKMDAFLVGIGYLEGEGTGEQVEAVVGGG